MRKWRYIIWAVAIIALGLVFLDGCIGEEKNLSGTMLPKRLNPSWSVILLDITAKKTYNNLYDKF